MMTLFASLKKILALAHKGQEKSLRLLIKTEKV